jgi:hypothetical protein
MNRDTALLGNEHPAITGMDVLRDDCTLCDVIDANFLHSPPNGPFFSFVGYRLPLAGD